MITPAQCRAARGLLKWTQTELAAAAGVAWSTVRDFEAERRKPIRRNMEAITGALEAAGVEFTNGDEPGVKLRRC
ncbi:MAG: helix-turn-helix domain-containing protein [Alphaproteobacteria bacterium]